MKTIILLLTLLLPLISVGQTNDHPFHRMKNYLGTWYLEMNDNLAQAGVPKLKFVCNATKADNGAYCEAYVKTESGSYEFMSSELLAYDESTNHFHAMSYSGNNVSYSSGPVDENGVWTYTSYDSQYNNVGHGRVEIKPESLTQEIT